MTCHVRGFVTLEEDAKSKRRSNGNPKKGTDRYIYIHIYILPTKRGTEPTYNIGINIGDMLTKTRHVHWFV